ncbi:MAG TPA: hypothetical protein VF482_09190, partial [Trebonia sp.]
MNAGIILADAGNIGLIACGMLDTSSVIAYWVQAHGGDGGKWWRSPFGWHLMCFMAAFAVVLDMNAVYLFTTGQVLLHTAPPGRPDWFAWVRVISFCTLIPAVLAWRLFIILRPPGRDLGAAMKRLLSPVTNPAGLTSAGMAVYAAVVMAWNASHGHGVLSVPVIVAAVSAVAALYTRQKVTPVAD